jgi:hypothetical protein
VDAEARLAVEFDAATCELLRDKKMVLLKRLDGAINDTRLQLERACAHAGIAPDSCLSAVVAVERHSRMSELTAAQLKVIATSDDLRRRSLLARKTVLKAASSARSRLEFFNRITNEYDTYGGNGRVGTGGKTSRITLAEV